MFPNRILFIKDSYSIPISKIKDPGYLLMF